MNYRQRAMAHLSQQIIHAKKIYDKMKDFEDGKYPKDYSISLLDITPWLERIEELYSMDKGTLKSGKYRSVVEVADIRHCIIYYLISIGYKPYHATKLMGRSFSGTAKYAADKIEATRKTDKSIQNILACVADVFENYKGDKSC